MLPPIHSDDAATSSHATSRTGRLRAASLALALWVHASPGVALTVEDAVRLVVETHPQIARAAANRQAIEFELDQARGRYFPTLDLTARSGFSYASGSSDNISGADDDPVAGWETRATLTQPIYDGGEIGSDVERQGYRIDAASHRVLERAEFLGLEAVRVYTDFLRNQELLVLAKRNLAYHRGKAAEIDRAVSTGVLGEADMQQARERVFAAKDSLTIAELDVENARIAFIDVVGVAPDGLGEVTPLAQLPASLGAALAEARSVNPRMLFAQSDIGAAEAQYRGASARMVPSLSLEGDVRSGENLDGFRGRESDARLGLVLRYQFNGGIDSANVQEQLRRVSETRAQLHEQSRFVEQEVRTSWALLESERRRRPVLERQQASAQRLLGLYQREFEVGQRTLLDLLNTRNVLFQAEIDAASSRYVELFAQYRLLASIGSLLPTLEIRPPVDATAYGAVEVSAPPVGDVEDQRRTDPWTPQSRLFGESEDR